MSLYLFKKYLLVLGGFTVYENLALTRLIMSYVVLLLEATLESIAQYRQKKTPPWNEDNLSKEY